jgi:hypothetical protein
MKSLLLPIALLLSTPLHCVYVWPQLDTFQKILCGCLKNPLDPLERLTLCIEKHTGASFNDLYQQEGPSLPLNAQKQLLCHNKAQLKNLKLQLSFNTNSAAMRRELRSFLDQQTVIKKTLKRKLKVD